MRTGAIFARGSCRALKWLTMFGVVFALGASEAAAQITVDVVEEVAESASATIEVTADVSIAVNAPAVDLVVTVSFDASGTNEDADVVLNPSGVITLAIPAGEGDPTEATVTGSVTLQTTQDPDAEDEDVVLAFALTGAATGADGASVAAPANATITIEDDETQTYVLSNSEDPTENQAITITVTAVPAHVDDFITIELYSSDPTYSFPSSPNNSFPVSSANDSVNSLTLTPPINDGNRVSDEVTVRALSGSLGAVADAAEALTITVADIHVLPGDDAITAEATDADGEVVTSVAEGGDSVSLLVTVDRGTGDDAVSPEALAVTLVPADSAQALDYRITPSNEVVIAAGPGITSSAAITLEALRDEDVGNEALVLNLVTTGDSDNGPGQSIGTFSIDLTDMTVTKIEPKSDADVDAAVDSARGAAEGEDGLNPGESFSVQVTDLFNGMEGDTVAYSASSSDDGSVGVSTSGTSVMVDAVSAGTATVTVTATVTGVSSAIPQSVSNVAQVAFDVMVDLVPFRVTLPDSLEVMEGGEVELTATANRAATEGATVTLVLPAGLTGDASITIATGMISGSTMLTAAEDDDLDDETLTVVASGDGVDGNKSITITVTDDDMETTYELAASADMVMEGGDAVTITATASQAVMADTMIELMHGAGSASADDYSLEPMMITIMAGGNSGSAMLTATDDSDVEGDESLTLNGMMENLVVGSVTLTITDNDMAPQPPDPTVYELAASADMVMEGGDAVTITATANPAVMEDTMIDLMHGAGSASADDYSLEPMMITIMAGATSGSAMLTATDDSDVEGDESLTLNGMMGNLVLGSVMLTITDNDMAPQPPDPTVRAKDGAAAMVADAIATAAGGSDWVVGGMAATVDMSMLFDVDAGVTAAFAGGSSDMDVVRAISSGNTLTLTPMAAGSATITVTGSDAASGSVATVMHDAMVALQTLSVTVTASATMVDEGGSVMLTATANRGVTAETTLAVTVTGDTAAVSADGTLTIAMNETTGTAMVMAVEDDDTADANVTVVVSGPALSSPATFDITITDNDMAPQPPDPTVYELAASADMVMEGGDAVTITATANPAVMEDTMIDLMHGAGSASADDYSLEPMMITIMAGATSGSAMLTATDDSDVEGDESLTLNGMMGNLVLGSVMLTITDNDMAPQPPDPTVRAKDGAAAMVADAIATAAGGSDWVVGGMAATVDMSMLFDVDAGVTAAFAGGSSDMDVVRAISSGNTLTLTPMAAGSATITVTGSDAASGSVATVMHDAMVALQTLSVTVTASATMVDEGGSVMLTATANRGVTAETTLAVTVTGDTAAVSADGTLTIAMNETTGTAMVMAVEDDDTADANVTVVVSGPALSSPATFDIAVTDNDRTVNAKSQGEVDAVFTVAIGRAGGADGWMPGGDAATVDMSELFTMTGGATVEYSAESSDDDMVMASASGSMLTLTPMETGGAIITVMATDTSGDADDTAMAMSMVTVGVLPLEITVMPATAEVTEGGTVEISAMANKMVDANVEVMLMRDAASTAGADDYSFSPALITIMAGDVMGKLTLTATDDFDVESTEMLMLVAMMGGTNLGSVVVTVMDNDMETTYTLSGPMDMNVAEGMSAELTVTANQAVMMDTMVMIMRDGASTASDADFTVESVTIMTGGTTGTTMVTAVEDGMVEDMEMLMLYGMVGDMSTNSVTLNLWDAAVPALPLIAQLLLAVFLAIGGYRRYLRR